MAKRVIQIITDDLTGEDGAQTRRFGLDGVEYAIDLTDSNMASFLERVQPYLDKARRQAGRVVVGVTDKQVRTTRKPAPVPQKPATEHTVTYVGPSTQDLRRFWRNNQDEFAKLGHPYRAGGKFPPAVRDEFERRLGR